MLSFFNLLMNIAILWTNEVIVIPIGESLDKYKSFPEATLYINDEVVEDKLMFYEYEINYTSFNVIRTHVVGSYTVWYRAHFPTLGFESEVAVTFIVKDTILPTITGPKDFYVDVGTKSIDYKTLISYTDNYTVDKDLILNIYAGQVNLNQLGSYQVTYSVKDKAFNESIWVTTIHVVDNVKPVIKQKERITILIGDVLNLDKFFTFSDNYDTALEVSYDDTFIHYEKPGSYPLAVTLKDQSGNEVTVNVQVEVVDTTSPVIILKTNNIKVNYLTDLTTDYLRSFIIDVKDNVDILNIEDVLITSYIDTHILGKYEVIYTIRDSNNLIGKANLVVEVIDAEAPKVSMKEDIYVDVHSLEPYIYDYLIIEDNYNKLEDLTITKTGSISMSKVGAYRVIVKVVDQAKNAAEYPVIVHVIDQQQPTLKVPSEIVITNFLRPNYIGMIEVKDNYDKDLVVIIEDGDINYNELGEHPIIIRAIDSSLNETKEYIHIKIIDLSYPEIILKTHQVYLAYGVDSVDYLSYVESVFDSYDKDLSIFDIRYKSTLDFNKVGLYQVIYELLDKSNNVGTQLLYIYLTDFEKPVIEATHITIKKGAYFNYKEHVTAYDNYDGDISYLVKMNPQFVPIQQVGYYEILFYVHDSSGNYSEIKVLLTIEAANDVMDYIYYIVGGVIILGSIIIYYIYIKKREKI
ncbi:hypothetical protein [Acholeplasma laidlawii]|uniref:hypothetical protein n=1 Tax=Acholeplasma laidlawii TaxID=2148 RepID=UPI003F92E9A9